VLLAVLESRNGGRSEDHEYENITIWRAMKFGRFMSEMNSGTPACHVESYTHPSVSDNHVNVM